MKKRSCKTCSLLGIATTVEGSWHICKHLSFREMFTDGRALDIAEHPEWCPKKPKPVVDFDKTPMDLFDKEDLEITTSKNEITGVCTAFVTHKPTGAFIKVNEYKTVQKNVNVALVRLHSQMLDD